MLLKIFAFLAAAIVILLIGVFLLGSKQPSYAISAHNKIALIGVKYDRKSQFEASRLSMTTPLWRGQTVMTLVGPDEPYWTEFLLLPLDEAVAAQLKEEENFDDLLAIEVAPTRIPAFALGILRAGYLSGFVRMNTDGPVELDTSTFDRPEILPSANTVDALKAASPSRQLTMLNFLQYNSEPGNPEDGRRAYQRYGRQAIKTVHSAGAQLLFAGRVSRVIVDSQMASTAGDWDDLAAMTYPTPTTVLRLESDPDYAASLDHRAKGLKRTVVIATESIRTDSE